jgi:nucleotide-binding universal stress UspA family protein
MIALQQILVATDFSEPSNAALTYGRELARSFGATLQLLHVVDDLGARLTEPSAYPELDRLQSEAEATALTRLHGLLSEEDRQTLHARALVLTSTSPAETITSYARDAMPRIGIIVMGTHGRGVMAHLVLGSVAERVVRSAPCPVLTVRHPQHEFVLPDALIEQRVRA